jgi:octanoyl-[GcvH]:protein N-octanoyltransferase
VDLLSDGFPGRAAFELAVTDALLARVAGGEREPALRVFAPAPAVAFGRLDALRPGYAAACDVALSHGFEPVVRLGGGHAAAFDEGSLVIDEVTLQAAVTQGLTERFERVTGTLAAALSSVAGDVRVGELPGEYCAGRWSLNVAGRAKVAGTAQRIVRGAALVTAVVVVRGGDRIGSVLADVYDALELPWDPATAGALEDAAPGVTPQDVRRAIAREWDVSLEPAALDAGTLALAERLEQRHRTPSSQN